MPSTITAAHDVHEANRVRAELRHVREDLRKACAAVRRARQTAREVRSHMTAPPKSPKPH